MRLTTLHNAVLELYVVHNLVLPFSKNKSTFRYNGYLRGKESEKVGWILEFATDIFQLFFGILA
jgi:hypothetical protein